MIKTRIFKSQWFAIVLFLIFSYPAVIQANYAMIFFLKAQIASAISIIVCLAGFSLLLLNKNQPDEEEQLNESGVYKCIRYPKETGNTLIWIGLSLYTLNIWYVLLVSVMWRQLSNYAITNSAFILQKKFPHQYTKWAESTPATGIKWANIRYCFEDFNIKKSLKFNSSLLLLIVATYVWLDTIREYSVWHEIKVRTIPMVSLLVAFSIFIYGLKLKKK